MSQQDYHQAANIFSTFSNGFERSAVTAAAAAAAHHDHHHHQHHIAQQIRREKLRVQGFDTSSPTPPLVGIDEDVESGALPVYETAGMLSEMFNFSHGSSSATELLEQQQMRQPQPPQPGNDWYGGGRHHQSGGRDSTIAAHHHHQHHQHPHPHHHHQISGINADSAAAMQLFLMNPPPRSPSPPTPAATTSSNTLHMLLPNPSPTSLQPFTHPSAANSAAAGGPFSQFTWVPDGGGGGAAAATAADIGGGGGVVESQTLSLSLNSSLQPLEAAKAEEFRNIAGNAGLLYYGSAVAHGGSNSAEQYPYKGFGTGHVGGGVVAAPNHHQLHVGYGSSLGVVNVLRNSKYVKAAQELLEEFCSVGRGHFKKNKFGRNNSNNNNNANPSSSGGGGGGGGSSSSSKDVVVPPLSAADRIEHQRRKVKLLSMLDEVDRRYNHYCEQMQMVVNSFDLVMGFGAAVPYTALAQKAMSRHFRCLKDAITAQLKHSCELLGEKDGVGSSGITKGETPRLKLLEQSLRQQRAFQSIGMMEQEAWRPQRGLPERSVNILRAWLFEHFLHPYPSDADKHLLARQTGLSRNQVSNWFINARVRLWKPMVEEMYQQESKDEDTSEDHNNNNNSNNNNNQERSENNNTSNNVIMRNNQNNISGHHHQHQQQVAQTPTPGSTPTSTTSTPPPGTAASSAPTATATAAAAAISSATPTASTPTAAATATTTPTGKRSDFNALENDPSLVAINRQLPFSENQALRHLHPHHPLHHHHHMIPTTVASPSDLVAPPPIDDTCRRVADQFGTTSGNNNNYYNNHSIGSIAVKADNSGNIGSALIGFGTTAGGGGGGGGDVSLTLGLRHAGNMPEKTPTTSFSVRNFGS